jgi:hypothetical protein
MPQDENRENIIIDGWKVSDLPVQYKEADYQVARGEIVQKMSQIPGMLALFEFGYIPVPGISDMDFRAVFSFPRTPCFPQKPGI